MQDCAQLIHANLTHGIHSDLGAQALRYPSADQELIGWKWVDKWMVLCNPANEWNWR
jgi:hypothetical protein